MLNLTSYSSVLSTITWSVFLSVFLSLFCPFIVFRFTTSCQLFWHLQTCLTELGISFCIIFLKHHVNHVLIGITSVSTIYRSGFGLVLWCLTPLSTIFQLYRILELLFLLFLPFYYLCGKCFSTILLSTQIHNFIFFVLILKKLINSFVHVNKIIPRNRY